MNHKINDEDKHKHQNNNKNKQQSNIINHHLHHQNHIKTEPELNENNNNQPLRNHKVITDRDLDIGSLVQSDNGELSLLALDNGQDDDETDNDLINRNNLLNNLDNDKPDMETSCLWLDLLMINEYISINRDSDTASCISSKVVKYLHKKRLNEQGYRMTNKKLGEGGYGTVYKIYFRNNTQQQQTDKEVDKQTASHNMRNNKPLACKIMLLTRKDKCTALENYSNEIYAMKQCLKHVNIVTIVDNFIYSHAISTENILMSHSYIVMEYAKLGTLWAKLKKHGPFVEEMAKYYFNQITSGLMHLHMQGIAHRDLKLGNILLTNNDQAQEIIKLADFGLSRLVNSKESGLVRFTKPAGTLAYMSPQIIACYINTNTNQNVSMHSYDAFKADIWALGVCLYLLLSKLHPFDNPPPNKAERIIFARKMLDKQLNREWQLPNNLEHPVSAACIGLLDKLFEPNSRKRINIYDVNQILLNLNNKH